jgi:hypothetical protein
MTCLPSESRGVNGQQKKPNKNNDLQTTAIGSSIAISIYILNTDFK